MLRERGTERGEAGKRGETDREREREMGVRRAGVGGARENRQAVSTGKICYRRGNAMWQLSMATAGGSGAEICCFRCVCMRV